MFSTNLFISGQPSISELHVEWEACSRCRELYANQHYDDDDQTETDRGSNFGVKSGVIIPAVTDLVWFAGVCIISPVCWRDLLHRPHTETVKRMCTAVQTKPSQTTERHLSYGIIQCYCHPTQVNMPHL